VNLTEAHRLAQVRLGAETAALVVATWQLLDPSDDESVRRWLAIVTPIIATQGTKSAQLAATYYQAQRLAETGENWTPITDGDLIEDQIRTSLLVTGPIAYRAALGRQIPPREALQGAQRTSARAGMRHALNGGRAALLANVTADDKAVGWRRVASVTACKYCSARSGTVVRADTVDFHSHDGCGCSAEPFFAA
jgi:hypothetical protein